MGNTQTTSIRRTTKLVNGPVTEDDERIQLNAIRSNLHGIPEEWIRQIEATVRWWDNRLSIQLNNQNLRQIPAWMSMQSHVNMVAEIDISGNRLREFPRECCQFVKLERLGLGSNEISNIPDEIGKLKNLVWFDFTHNRISTISEELGDLPKLASLGASDCRLLNFPIAFTRLAKLKKLGCFNNLIGSIPPEIGNLTGLTKLDLSGNNISYLPPEIGKLVNLAWFNISNNRLESLPDEINNLVNIKELGLAHNRLKTLPNLGKMKQLSLLTAFNNELCGIGDWICEMISLQKIDLSSNQLTSLPAGIVNLPNLQLLNVRGNSITEIHSPCPRNYNKRPKSLQVLDVRDNQLVTLPFGMLGPETILVAGNHWLKTQIGSSHYVPSLLHLSMTSVLHDYHLPGARRMLNHVLPSTIRQSIREMEQDQAGWCCQHCERIFVYQPVRWLDSIQGSDDEIFPCLTIFCSVKCRDSFCRNSGNLGRRRSSDFSPNFHA